MKKRKNEYEDKLLEKKLCEIGQSSREVDESKLAGVGMDQPCQAL